ncbi:hypothetical protein GCM10009808_15630 [Microbacterium sediminicola]|uniref:TadE-like protein n=1 Tax=Microbacterium sediminicola TaxID=415210 RepID=A0ABP4U8V4_9MICO
MTAEFAIALTAVALVLAAVAGLFAGMGRQLLLQDAVSDAARLIARGESSERARSVILAAVPEAGISIESRDDMVCVLASVSAPLGVDLRARSCALAGGR